MTEIQAGPRRRPVRLLAPALRLAAAVAVAVPLVFSGGAPAYAITKNADGTIQISINEAKNPKALQAYLEKMGLRAVVDFISKGKRCSPQPRSASWVPREEAKLTVFPPTEGSAFTIGPSAVKEGQTAVLEFGFDQNDGVRSRACGRASPTVPVAECTLVDSPGAPWARTRPRVTLIGETIIHVSNIDESM
ncbi:hypothetical protein AB0G06_34015 [Nonomuraea dietziae]|uniref:hypothetical protein n=1 Tax=Nonomuraea dietziae TaxID=65515 RepID=UPI0033F9C5FB